jgi:hypothetical protein
MKRPTNTIRPVFAFKFVKIRPVVLFTAFFGIGSLK